MKMLITVAALIFSLNSYSLGNDCSVQLEITDEGMIFGKTNSKDLFSESAYKDFQVEDDDGFITQMVIFNKLLDQKKSAPQLTVEDSIVLGQAIDRAIKYSTNEKILNNPKLKPADKENLIKVAIFNKGFKDSLLKIRSTNHTIDPTVFKNWAMFMEAQRHEHYFTLFGAPEQTRGIINLCGAYPPSTPECCKYKIAELNNVLAMSLCNRNFVTKESVTKVFPNGKTSCKEHHKLTYVRKNYSSDKKSNTEASKQ